MSAAENVAEPETPVARAARGALGIVDPRFLLLYFVAFLPRIALFPLFRHLVTGGDEVYYWRQAGREFLRYQLRPPLWPLLLKLARFFSDDPLAGRLLAVAVGSLLAPLLFLLVRRLFDARTAWVAALLAALYPDHVVWSHFLWTESFVSVLLVAACLTIFPGDAKAPLRMLAGGAVLGLVFLAKEYGLMAFAALAVTYLFTSDAKPARRIGTLALSFVLLLVPTLVFTGAVAAKTGKLRMPHGAAIGNARQEADQRFRLEEGALQELIDAILAGRGEPVLEDLQDDYRRLWGARSFALWRLSREHYGTSVSKGVIYGMVAIHVVLMIVGLVGLLAEPKREFMLFALGCLAFLSLSALPGYMVSRFRTPFMFLFIIGAARLVAAPELLQGVLRSRVRATACLIGTLVLAALFLSTYRGVHLWG